MKKIFKSPFALTLIFFAGLGLAALSPQGILPPLHSPGEVLTELLDKFNRAAMDHPEDRVYLHLDKPFYKPGETIWFKSFVRNGADMRASSQSDIVHVELINPKGSVEKKIKIISKKGQGNGDFYLDPNAPGGMYKIKAFTQWQKNEPGAPAFEKEVQVQAVVLPKLKMKLDFDRKAFGPGDEVTATVELTSLENQPIAGKSFLFIVNLDGDIFLRQRGISDQNGLAHLSFNLPADLKTSDGLINMILEHQGNHESISRSVPIVLNKIDLQLFPEGGDLVQGLETRVAFKALNEFGKPADVEGVVENSKGEKICSFKSFHQGMGAFVLKPQHNEKYFAKITQPANIRQTFELPEALSQGYVLNVTEINKDGLAIAVASSEDEEMFLVAQVRGKIYHTSKLQVRKGENKAFIPTYGFPMGVAQVSLFDIRGIARAERLAFVNKKKQLKVTVGTDKEKYLPREKVKLTLKVTDERGIPMPADFSIAVADDKLISFADDRSGNILSKMFLEYDLKEKVEEPAFYFDTTKQQADLALDYLMMTAGWRRFTWQQVTDNNLPKISFYGEKAIVGGLVADGETGKPVAKARLEFLQSNTMTQTNDQGYFSLDNVDLSEGITLKITAGGYTERHVPLTEYDPNMQLTIYRTNYHTYHWSKPEGLENKQKARNFPNAARNLEMMAAQAPVAEQVIEENEIGNGRKEPILLPQNEIIELPKAVREEAKKIINLNREIALEAEEGHDINNIRGGNWAAAYRVASPLPSQYYRTRQFPQIKYTSHDPVHIRNDFRSTIYWNGNISTDRTGKAIVEFYNSDEITSFRVVAEGMSADGLTGRSEKVYFTQLPFSMAVKAPVEVSFGDLVSIPLTLTNNTPNNVTGTIAINHPAGLHPVRKMNPVQSIAAGLSRTIYLDYQVRDSAGTGILQVEFKSSGLRDVFTQEIQVAPRGFPSSISFSGKYLEKEYTFQISNVVPGSMKASFTAYPSVMSDLMKGIESIIREPYGCFEQTSTSNYPNILIKQYLQQMGEGGAKKKITIPQGLDALLDKGYKKLTSYETKEKGYEWFGGTPAHEALTAYGLMQFNDMKAVYPEVDQAMIDRTASWLMGRRDGKGGFKKSSVALDQFGRANEEVTNAYIVYALSEAGYRGIGKESDEAYEKAMSTKDPYQLALLANTMYNLKDPSRAAKALALLQKLQKEDGSWNGATHSITCSSGNSLLVETTSLSVMALLKSGSPDGIILNKAVEFIVSSRNGYGGFGSTQGTVLALKALTEYAKYSKKTDEDGQVEIYLNERRIAVKEYKAGETQPVLAENLEKFLKEGSHTIRIKYLGVKNPLPYSIAVNYNTFLPSGSKQCKVSLKTELNAASITTGETVRLSATLSNISQEGLPMTMAIIGIPGGMTAQPWQLKELQEKQCLDFYEVKGSNVFLYFRQMRPGEKKIVNLDLKAEIAGEFEAPASCAYLYYTNEFKSWGKPERILIKK